MPSAGTQNTKVTLYWLNKSRSHRILWLLEELKVNYEVKVFKRQPNMFAPPELEKIHPLGKSPVISVQREGESQPLILAESGLIIEYLCEHFGPQYIPKRYKDGQDGQVCGETDAYMRYRWYMQFAEGSMMFFLVSTIIPTTIRKQAPFFLKFITNAIAGKIEEFIMPNIKKQLTFLEGQAETAPEGGPWLCGAHLSGADFIMSFPLQGCKQFKLMNEKDHPKLMAYVNKVEATESYKRAVQKIVEVDGSFDGVF